MVSFKRFKLVCSSSVMEEEQTSLKRLKETITELSQCAVVRQMGIDVMNKFDGYFVQRKNPIFERAKFN